MSKVPLSAVYMSECLTGNCCYAASHRMNGDVLVGTSSSVKVFKKQDDMQLQNGCNGNGMAVIEYQKIVYVLRSFSSSSELGMYLPKLKVFEKLFEFQRMSTVGEVATLAVSDRYIAATNPDTTKLVIYDILKETKDEMRLPVQLYGLHFLPDGHLLATEYNGDKLMKYKIEDGKPSLIWTCVDKLVNASNVTSDSYGNIYVSTNKGLKTIYILSPYGKKVEELKNDKLPENTGSISIQEDELAVPGMGTGSLRLFKLKRREEGSEQLNPE